MAIATDLQAERRQNLKAYARDDGLARRSLDWVRESMDKRYVYNFDWLGRPIIQYPAEVQAIQEIIWRTRPDVVVETGIAHGGSLVLHASMMALLDYCDAALDGNALDPRQPRRRVVGVDIEIRPHNRAAIEAHPLAQAISMIEGSSTDGQVVAAVAEAAYGADRVMVCLDSRHTHDHVLAELEAYAPMVTPGCYCIVLDTFIEDMPTDFFPGRPWNVGNNPRTALQVFLKDHPEFETDAEFAAKLMITAARDGYLRRKEEA
ncbi:MAG: cephalosporin hydroxylase family protein [Alphaproteobacteria bacterium]